MISVLVIFKLEVHNNIFNIIFQNLGKLEIFTLFQNNISKVENLGCQQNLEIFSIGNNLIEDESCVS